MKTQHKTLSLVLGGAFAASVAVAPLAGAAENPFAVKSLSSGYMVADNLDGDKMNDGKCGTGKCGSSMKKKKAEAAAAGKPMEGDGGAEMKAKEGNCGAEKKAKEGNCGASK